MIDLPEFETFKRIPRIARRIIVTEKIDGTNGCVWVNDTATDLYPASRNQWLHPDKPDNYDFGNWVRRNKEELLKLGPGFHYGEWWGIGVARRYNINERRWSLFNTSRWNNGNKPQCCHVVPVLAEIDLATEELFGRIESITWKLRSEGSKAAPGFMNPEGVVIFHEAAQQYFKYTFDGDGHKSARK